MRHRGVEYAVTSSAPGVWQWQFRIGDVRHVVASPQRAVHELGFTARVRPDEGLARFATEALRP